MRDNAIHSVSRKQKRHPALNVSAGVAIRVGEAGRARAREQIQNWYEEYTVGRNVLAHALPQLVARLIHARRPAFAQRQGRMHTGYLDYFAYRASVDRLGQAALCYRAQARAHCCWRAMSRVPTRPAAQSAAGTHIANGKTGVTSTLLGYYQGVRRVGFTCRP